MPAAAAREGLTLVGRVKRQERGREREREEERGRKREREGRPRRESPGTKRQRERACVEKGGSGRGKVERGERGREEKLESREKIYLGGGQSTSGRDETEEDGHGADVEEPKEVAYQPFGYWLFRV